MTTHSRSMPRPARPGLHSPGAERLAQHLILLDARSSIKVLPAMDGRFPILGPDGGDNLRGSGSWRV